MARYYRKIIRITAEDSPNVRLFLAQLRAGIPPTHNIIIPGVLPSHEYVKRRNTWDAQRQCVSLDAQFYEGADVLMYPPRWLDVSHLYAQQLAGRQRICKGIGIDPAEGGDSTTYAASDEYGLIELIEKKTPDTNVVIGETLAFMRKHNCPPERVCFDRGGGGKQHADRLRAKGYRVRTVSFGESLSLPLKRGMTRIETRQENREERTTYKNRRAQMYDSLRLRLNPARVEDGLPVYAIPRTYVRLRHELSPIPLTYDEEGRLYILPKNKRHKDQKTKTLIELIGHSPDCADATVLSIFAMENVVKPNRAGGSL